MQKVVKVYKISSVKPEDDWRKLNPEEKKLIEFLEARGEKVTISYDLETGERVLTPNLVSEKMTEKEAANIMTEEELKIFFNPRSELIPVTLKQL